MSRDTFSTSFTCSRARHPSSPPRLYFYYTRRSCDINLSIPFFLFFFSLFLTSTINSSSRRRTKEGISFSGRSHRSSFALKKKKKKNSNKSLESMLDTLWKRKTRSLAEGLEVESHPAFLINLEFFRKVPRDRDLSGIPMRRWHNASKAKGTNRVTRG